MLVMWYGFILPRYLNLSSSGRNNQPWMCLLPTLDIISKLLKDRCLSVPPLARACFVSFGLLLISSAAQAQVCQSEMVSAEQLGLEYFVSEAKTNSLLEAPLSEYCPAAKHSNSLFEAYNNAYKKAADCYYREDLDYNEMMDKWADSVGEEGELKENYIMACE